jgi:hypothetical protein
MLLLVLLASFSASAFAQQTGLSGVISDVQGAALPGVKVEAKKTDGSSFFSTTNGQGVYVIPSLAAAEYTVTASAPNFATVQKKVQLLVGQLAQIDLSLPIATSSAEVIVQASDDLAIDTTSSVVAGNVTPKEVQDVPINGRNYIGLSTLVPGIKGNSFGDVPVSGGDAETGKFQITMDGVQVSQDSVGSSFGQPRFSQDAISQFQIITNRFDATAGRSAGIYVNTQSKSGTNLLHGGAFGYFRNDFFNASDPIAKKVLPFSDQQYGGTLGGSIKKDKIWYFGSYEGEHQPNTFTATPIITGVLFSHPTLLQINEYLGRVDYQLNEKNHIFVRGDAFTYSSSYDGSTTDPSSASSDARKSYGYVADWNRSINDKLINDFHAGFHYFKTTFLEVFDTPVLQLPNPTITLGSPYNRPETFTQPTQEYRDDLFWLKGKHSFKVGGEFLYLVNNGYFGQNIRGSIACTGTSATPPYATFFPKGTTDSSTWNYAAIQAFCPTITYVQGFGNFTIHIPRKIIGVWAQDDWKILPRLTVNLGVRYDNDIGAFLNNLRFNNGLLTPNTNPNLNFAPRLGFSYDPWGDGKTSIRGGAGLYFADINANPTIDDQLFNGVTTVQATVTNPSNLASPFAGQDPAGNPSAYITTPQFIAQGASTPYSLQASFGAARQLPMKTTLTADFVHTRTYNDFILLDGNLLQNPLNPQQNLNPTAVLSSSTTRVCGNGAIQLDTIPAYTTAIKQVCNQHFGSASTGTGGNRQFTTSPGAGMIADALEVGIKHATTAGFTGAIAYTWGRTKNSTNGAFSYPNKPFIPGIQQEWANGTDDQRHTLTVNGQYNWKYGLMVSGLYHFGSGQAYGTTSGNSGVNGYTAGTRTFAANTTPIAPGQTCPATPCVTIYAPLSKVSYDAGYGYWVIQRDAFRGRAYHRMDSRLQESFKIHERFRAIVAVEAFNLFNHSNYAAYGTVATSNTGSTAYGVPTASGSSAIEYAARELQFIGRIQF